MFKKRKASGSLLMIGSAVFGVLIFGAICFTAGSPGSAPMQMPKVNLKAMAAANRNIKLIPVSETPFGDMKIVAQPLLDAADTPEPPKPSELIRVVGLLPPDIAMVSKGGKVGTVYSNTETDEFGSIGAITSTGVYIDGDFCEYKMLNQR